MRFCVIWMNTWDKPRNLNRWNIMNCNKIYDLSWGGCRCMKLKHIGRSQKFEISYRSIKGWSQNWLKIHNMQVSVIWIVSIWLRLIVLRMFVFMPWKKGVKGREISGFKKRHCLDVKDLLPVCNSILSSWIHLKLF